jgi:hypothetical protein
MLFDSPRISIANSETPQLMSQRASLTADGRFATLPMAGR